ncbi:MAG: helix-turn-helix domain-containing protein, partial [Lacrimispora sphenoides]
CRVFKKYKGTSPIEYFTKLKIEKAKELMIQFPDLSLRKISESLGFNDVYYFSKVFKKITGIAPSEMRACEQRL